MCCLSFFGGAWLLPPRSFASQSCRFGAPNGEISPQDTLISDNQEYRELQHWQSKNKAELLEALSDEQKELLEKFCATEIELSGISEREAFTAGFKIAMRLAAETFYEADNE